MPAKPRKVALPLDVLRLDFQPTYCLDEDTVQQYLERFRSGEEVKPIRVRFDGEHYFVEDGFHRVEVARRLGRKQIEAAVLPGTRAAMEARFQPLEIKKVAREGSSATRTSAKT